MSTSSQLKQRNATTVPSSRLLQIPSQPLRPSKLGAFPARQAAEQKEHRNCQCRIVSRLPQCPHYVDRRVVLRGDQIKRTLDEKCTQGHDPNSYKYVLPVNPFFKGANRIAR